MAYGVIHFFPGGTQSQYDETVGEVHPAGGGLPEGQLFPCRRRFRGRLDDHGRTQLERWLGKVPRWNPYSAYAEGH